MPSFVLTDRGVEVVVMLTAVVGDDRAAQLRR